MAIGHTVESFHAHTDIESLHWMPAMTMLHVNGIYRETYICQLKVKFKIHPSF